MDRRDARRRVFTQGSRAPRHLCGGDRGEQGRRRHGDTGGSARTARWDARPAGNAPTWRGDLMRFRHRLMLVALVVVGPLARTALGQAGPIARTGLGQTVPLALPAFG